MGEISDMMIDYPSRDAWLAARSTFVGASESAALFGCGYSGQNALTVYASKVRPEENDFGASQAMIVGSLIEPGLVRVFEHFAGLPAYLEKPFRVRHAPEHHFLAATLDAEALDPEAVPVELKNVDARLMAQWADDEMDGCPLKFHVQVQHQLAVTGASHAYLMGLIGGNRPVIRRLERNEEFVGVLVARVTEFWGFVQRRELPTDLIDWSESATSDAIKRLHPDDNGETVVLPAEAQVWYEQLEDAKAAVKEAEKLRDEAKNKLCAAIGDNTFGVLRDGTQLSWKTQERAEYVAKASKFRVLR